MDFHNKLCLCYPEKSDEGEEGKQPLLPPPFGRSHVVEVRGRELTSEKSQSITENTLILWTVSKRKRDEKKKNGKSDFSEVRSREI